ncbi:MAG TPA: endonuclease/exonuclease/phosphatase family protein [Thermodesulfobacteriota bacterium]|nr:endonuclease/exonuclease/phosphatase family protein [Thermodesulfobacteriota bacterium]
MQTALLAVACIFIIATLLPLLRHEAWWIRIFDFPRTQIAVGGALTIIIYSLLYKERGLADNLVLLVCVAYQVSRMFPYMRLSRKQVLGSRENGPDRKISILVSNIYKKNRNYERFLELVRDKNPDVICILEPDEWWNRMLSPLEEEYPYSARHHSNDGYGMIFFTRLKPSGMKVDYLVEDYVPSVFAVLELRSGEPVEFYCLHPNPPNPKYSTDTTERDAELLMVGKRVKESGRPALVAGDLNDVAWSHTTLLFLKISGMLDPRIGRGFFNTFHVKWPFLRFPLDHIFVTASFRYVTLETLPDIGSDHFPIYAELSYEPGIKEAQANNKYEASAEDKKEARQKIKEAREQE